MLLSWIIANPHFIIALAGWIVSEVAGLKSGAKSASVVQIISDFIKEIIELIAVKK